MEFIDILKYTAMAIVSLGFITAWRKRRAEERGTAGTPGARAGGVPGVATEPAPVQPAFELGPDGSRLPQPEPFAARRPAIEAAWEDFARRYPPDTVTAPASEPTYIADLPEDLRIGWERYRAISFGNGRFWLADPDEWTAIMQFGIEDYDEPEPMGLRVVARGAFGEVLIYDGEDRPYYWLFPLLVQGPEEYFSTHFGYEHTDDIRAFFSGPEELLLRHLKVGSGEIDPEWDAEAAPDLFEAVLERCGPVAEDEVYGTTPPELIDQTWGTRPETLSRVEVAAYCAAIEEDY